MRNFNLLNLEGPGNFNLSVFRNRLSHATRIRSGLLLFCFARAAAQFKVAERSARIPLMVKLNASVSV